MTPAPTEFEHRTDDGLLLHLREWMASGAPRGTVLIVHGLGEHTGRYAHVARALNAAGWQVLGYDHRGHGRSEGARGGLVHDDDLLRDLAGVIEEARRRHGGPLVLLGHSMGGLIAARFVAGGLDTTPPRWFRPVDALVLSSPALAADTNAVQELLLAVLGRLAPGLALNNGLKPAWISRDPQVVAAYQADPLVHDRITARLARFILDGGEHVRRLAARWTMPTLLLWAGSDRCVAPRGSAEFAGTAPKAVVESQVYPALFHEIFNEPEQQQVIERLCAWLAQR
jgi:alpha-beta hydrolase superfamily lysophospholipase